MEEDSKTLKVPFSVFHKKPFLQIIFDHKYRTGSESHGLILFASKFALQRARGGTNQDLYPIFPSQRSTSLILKKCRTTTNNLYHPFTYRHSWLHMFCIIELF
jgi:hypothetical protein